MAFRTPYTHNGFTYPEAYCKATIARLDTAQVVIKIFVYPNEACRTDNYTPIVEVFHVLDTDLDNWTANPIACCYSKLEAAGIYPDATWNV